MKQIVVIVLAYFIAGFECKGLKEEFTWTRLNYWWPGRTESRSGYWGGGSDSDEIVFPGGTDARTSNSGASTSPQTDGSEGSYVFENNIPMGANRWKDKLFITVPRRRVGVPSTLNFVWMNSTERHNVPLIAYPNWRINQFEPTREADGLVSVYRTAVDRCDRLWTIDTGLIETPGNNTRVKPAEIVIIDLNTDQIIRRYTFKSTDVTDHSTLANLAIDVTSDTCGDAFAYIPDLSGYGLIVYDFHENDSWRVTHNYFYLESVAGEFHIGGVSFQWNDGVFSVALSSIEKDGYRTLYFHSMAGTHLFSVSTRILRGNKLATRSYHESDFKVVADRGEGSQTSASDLHQPTGVLFLSLVNQNAVGCWNINKSTRKENFDIVEKHDQKLIYPSDLKVYEDEVIVLSNTMPVFLYSKLNYDEINFRVWISKVSDAVQGTACSAQRKSGYRH